MTGRARARSRGRARGQEPSQAAAPGMAPKPAAEVGLPQPSGEGELLGRGRQKGPPGAVRPEGMQLQISAGFQQMKIGERGGRRSDFHDTGIHTRQAMEHVKESKTGVSGSTIELRANFFRIISRPQWVLYQYHVDYNPQMESRRLRSALLFKHDEVLGTTRTFDGSILFLPHRLPNTVTELFSETRSGENVRVTITLTNELPPTSPVCLQFYNIIFRRVLRILNMQQIGRHYYNPNDPLNIPHHRLMIWPGFTTSILQYESSIMLCTDVSHKVLRSETVLSFMSQLRQQCGDKRFPEACTKELVGLIVLTRYNNKTYRIDDIAWEKTPNNTFKKGDKDISFKEYYKSQYNLDICDNNQVLLVSQLKRQGPAGGAPRGPALLVPEFCYLTGLTDKMRSDFNIMKDLSSHTRLTPEQREQRMDRFITNINRDPNAQAELTSWGLNFDNKLLSLKARVLPTERISQGAKIYEYSPWVAEWSREMRGAPLISTRPLENWLMLYTRRNLDSAQALLQALNKVSPPLGIRVQRACMIEIEDRQESLMRALQHNVNPQTQMVVCILPNNRKDKYDAVKKFLCVDCPTPSQCVVARTLSKPQALMTIATKIALQMNCKMGGELWSVEIPLKQLMIVGIDCYHDIVAGKRSIAGLVASLNQGMTRWFSKCVLQSRGQEIVDGLKISLQAALKAWYKHNNCLPSRIIVYRDGVGDGQLQSVVNYEVPQIMGCIKALGQDYNPKLTVVVVKKRVSARFFARIDGKPSNPPPGTVIDNDVTRPEWYDFYIVSQAVRVGSVSPTHYNVIYDSSGLKPDYMQRLTYKMCHMYYNWSGIVRVPAPCQYAHKLAFLVGQSIHREPNTNLDDFLYYL
uniref:Piwi-like protein 1 n=1 Tax=Acipenser dabryanus TaxID=62061 RepID=A0A343FM43_ACIDA|nr:piwi-like protein 1 [Acipenser dabryanus]